MKQLMETVKAAVGKAEQKTVAVAACTSRYHRHQSKALGGEYDECTEGGEHVFDGTSHKLVGDRIPWYSCIKCGKASMMLYRCVRRGR